MLSSPSSLLDRWLSPAPPPARVRWLSGVTYAHRGVHGVPINGRAVNGSAGPAVENSLSASDEAIRRGLGIECDVQRCAGDGAVVFHDWQLDRLTTRAGAVRDIPLARLCTIPLAGGEDRIPSLRQVLDRVGGRVPLLIEVKSRADLRVAPLCLAVRRALEGYAGPVAVMSFDARVARWFARHSPATVRGLVVSEEGRRTAGARVRRHLALWRAKPDFLAFDVRDLPSRFAAAQRRRGLPLLAWTVRSADLAARARIHADAAIAEGGGLA